MQQTLFAKESQPHYGDGKQHQNLFLPKYLQQKGGDERLRDEDWERAYKILCRWADLEKSGKIAKQKETTLQVDFLSEVFGKALGFTPMSKGLDSWNLYPQFPVNGGAADAALGVFDGAELSQPYAMVELKGPLSNLDKDRSNGRTPVQQCWDYLNAAPECPWGIVSNYVSFRLYHRNKTPRAYQLFLLRDLRDPDIFASFYYVLQREGLIPKKPDASPRSILLLNQTSEQQRRVGDDLYNAYAENRAKLIYHLTNSSHKKSLDTAIHIAQKLIDRIVFVAFCEDRGLLPERTINSAYTMLPPFSKVTNPRWQNFKNLFRSIDKGNPPHGINAYNGGLFREDTDVDNLELDDEWTNFFDSVGRYDFRDEVNVDVLGHLFERSVGDISKIKAAGLLEPVEDEPSAPKMGKSAERKRSGVYYTPPEFTSFIAHNVINAVIDERFLAVRKRMQVTDSVLYANTVSQQAADYFRACIDELRDIKIVDPACGSGAFLIAAYDLLEERYRECFYQYTFHSEGKDDADTNRISEYILNDNLFGVDLSPEAVEITQLALWIRSAQEGQSLSDLSENIVCGNSLVSSEDVDSRSLCWDETFPAAFKRKMCGFDCVIGNPPWERMKLQEREFFDIVAPDIAGAVSAAERRKKIEALKKRKPELYQRYQDAKNNAEVTLEHVRAAGNFPLTAKGDINTYALFAELAMNIVSASGRVGLLVPSGIATDKTTKDFFGALLNFKRLIALYDFENKDAVFPDVHRSFKFSVFLFGGAQVENDIADFVFFTRSVSELKKKSKHIALSTDDIKLLNPNTHTCPIFRSQRDTEITKAIYRRVPVLIDHNRKTGGNPWGIRFLRMFDQTNDAELFHTAEQVKELGCRRYGPVWKRKGQVFLPLYEAKMIQMYDHRAAGVRIEGGNWMRQGQTVPATQAERVNPEFFAVPRWWVQEGEVATILARKDISTLFAYKDVTSATNTRTMIASFIPLSATLNSAPLVIVEDEISLRRQCCLLGNLNSFVYDYVARQKVGGVHLNFFIIEQLPMFPPDFYNAPCPWDTKTTLEHWISDRTLKLTCTSNDMQPLAEAAGFDPPVHKWNPKERAELMAELDAAYFILYEIEREDVAYILSTFSGVSKEEDNLFGGQGAVNRILKHYDKLRGAMAK